jgi:hypothetical protein
MEPRNRFQGMNSASLCSLAGRYDNPIPPRFLAPIDSLKIPALSLQLVFCQCGLVLLASLRDWSELSCACSLMRITLTGHRTSPWWYPQCSLLPQARKFLLVYLYRCQNTNPGRCGDTKTRHHLIH